MFLFSAGIGPRALSNGINSAVFFCFFEAIRSGLKSKTHLTVAAAISAWAEQARDRVAQVPRFISTVYDKSFQVPQRFAGVNVYRFGTAVRGTPGTDSNGGHLQWATAGVGGGLALLAGAASTRGLQMVPGCCDDAELMLYGSSGVKVCGGRPAVGPMSLSLLARASPLRLEDSQLVMAVQALKSVEESTNITLEDD